MNWRGLGEQARNKDADRKEAHLKAQEALLKQRDGLPHPSPHSLSLSRPLMHVWGE